MEYISIRKRLGAVAYNLDRTIASAWLGTTQETISSEVGRIARGQWTPRYPVVKRLAIALADWLDKTPKIWGYDHTSKAIQHADKLDSVDDGREQ